MPKIFGKKWRLRTSRGKAVFPGEPVTEAAETYDPAQAAETAEADFPAEADEANDPAEADRPTEANLETAKLDAVVAAQTTLADRTIVDRVHDAVETTIQRLSEREFDPDPLAGPHFSRMVSLFSSAYKRHGNVLELAIREQLSVNNNLVVWAEPVFNVSQKAANMVAKIPLENAARIPHDLDYGDDAGGRLQVDIMVWNKTDKSLRAYEIKRGHGRHDAGKIRSIKRELFKIDVLLKSYGKTKGFTPKVVSSHVVFYYGNQSIPSPLGMSGEELDGHFGMSVRAEVELVNQHFRRRLFEILADQ